MHLENSLLDIYIHTKKGVGVGYQLGHYRRNRYRPLLNLRYEDIEICVREAICSNFPFSCKLMKPTIIRFFFFFPLHLISKRIQALNIAIII